MSRSRRPVRHVAGALAAVLACSLVATATASAGGTILDGAATFTRGASGFDTSPDANFSGVSATGSQDHLFENGWAYRVSGDTAEAFMPTPTSETYVGNSSTITWTDVAGRNLFDAVEASEVHATGGPSGSVTQKLTITNRSASVPLSISVFHMADFDLQPTFSNDAAKLIPGTKHIRITDTGTNYAGYEAPTADHYLVRAFATTTDVAGLLSNTTVDDFADTGLPFGPGDITAGWQWSTVSIAPSSSQSFTVRLSVNDATATTTTLSTSPSPSTAGGDVRLTANVAATTGGTPATSGTVTFLDNGSPIDTVPVVDGVATRDVNGFAAGTHPLTAVYNGSESLLASTSAALDHVVETGADASVSNNCTPSPVTAGEAITCQSSVTSAGSGPVQGASWDVTLPAGTTFTSLTPGSGWSCMTPAVGAGGTVSCAKDVVAVGATDDFTLVLGIDAGAAPGPLSVSATVSTTSVDPVGANNTGTSGVAVTALSTTAVTSDGTPVVAGTAVTLKATVSGAGAPEGDVQFYDDGTPLGAPVTLSAGVAKLVTSSLAAGSHPITATYAGSTDHVGSSSATFTQVVTTPPPPVPPAPPAPAPGPGPGVAPASPGDAIGLGGTPASALLGDDGSLALDLSAKPGATGTLTVTALVAGKKKKGAKKKPKAKVVKLVSKSFVVPASGKLPVRVKVPKSALAKLPRKTRSFKATLTIKVGTQTVTRKFTLKRPKPKKKRPAR